MNNKYILTTQSIDQIGIVSTLTNCLSTHDGFIHELAQFGTPITTHFFSRISFSMPEIQMRSFRDSLVKVSDEFSLTTEIIPQIKKTKTLIMVSKFDHCLNDILYRHSRNSLNIEITAVVSNHESSRADVEAKGIPFHYVPITKDTKIQAEKTLRTLILSSGTELIVLARYMQVLSEDVCCDFSGRIINIHHSFLPGFKGAKPYHRAYKRGVKQIGATAHYVTRDLDEGPIISQSITPVDHTMTISQLITTGRDVESQTLAKAIKLHTEHRIFINDSKTVILP